MHTADLERLQEQLGHVLTAADPVAAWRRLLPGHALDMAGLRVAALLVAKLRFQRLMNGSRHASEWFARDAREFTEAFRRYHSSQPPRSLDPWTESAQFERWLASRVEGDEDAPA